MVKKFLWTTVFTGFALFLFSCSNPATSEQLNTTTELPPIPTPTTEIAGIRLNAEGSGDYPDLVTAIEAAKARENIILAAGTYRLDETLKINKSITLIGAGMDKTNIVSSTGGAVLYFAGDGIYALDGITIEHEGSLSAHAVLVENGEINFSNCRFTGATGTADETTAGLLVRGLTTGEVKYCQADNNTNTGILITEDSSIKLEANTCENNRGVGIAYRKNAKGTARNNACNKNDFAGFYLDGSSRAIHLEENDCSENGTAGSSGGGIMIRGNAAPTLMGNTCNANIYAGITYGGSAQGNAVNNECSENGFAGIYLEGEAKPTLEGNTCNKNGTDELGAGIAYFNSSGGTAKGNTVKDNLRDGIFVGNDSAPEVVENICNGNHAFGIHFLEAKGGSARSNQCSFNQQVGILVDTNSTPLIEENSCASNLFGIYVVESADPELVKNDLHDNITEDLRDMRPGQ